MQPHIKLLVIDSVNFYLSLLADNDRRALIQDLNEQQKVFDSKEKEKKSNNGGETKKSKKVIEEYM